MRSTVYWIDGPWPGRLAIVPRPRGGDWLEDEVTSWRDAGIDVVVSALTKDEDAVFQMENERELVRSKGLQFYELAIPDRGVPRSVQELEELARNLERELASGRNVGVHCRQSIGRASLITAATLMLGGLNVNDALQRVQSARGCPVPETAEQKEWLIRFAKSFTAKTYA